jgi:hypothetical protein
MALMLLPAVLRRLVMRSKHRRLLWSRYVITEAVQVCVDCQWQ